MDGRKLDILMKAVEAGSFLRASESVGYTQSGLTHLCDGIEKEMGVSLITRDHNGISLSESGRELLPYIKDLVRADSALEEKVREMSEAKTETIRVAAYASIAMHWMPEILYRFRRICPDVIVDLRTVDNALEPFEILRDGKADVVFASRQEDMDCDWTPLYRDYMYAILPKGFLTREEGAFSVDEFSGHDFLMPYGKFDLDVSRALSGMDINIIQTYVDDETVIRMVGKGLGVSMMGKLMIRGKTDDVICLPVKPGSYREMGIGISKRQKAPDAIRKLHDCVVEFSSEL